MSECVIVIALIIVIAIVMEFDVNNPDEEERGKNRKEKRNIFRGIKAHAEPIAGSLGCQNSDNCKSSHMTKQASCEPIWHAYLFN